MSRTSCEGYPQLIVEEDRDVGPRIASGAVEHADRRLGTAVPHEGRHAGGRPRRRAA